MKIYDITVTISAETPVYEGDPPVEMTVASAIAHGDAANVSRIACGFHTGTHVDAPAHFIEGARRVSELDLGKLIGTARVVEIDESVTAIAVEHLENVEGAERLLFKTRNSDFWNDFSQGFRKDFTYITPDAARRLADLDVKLVGIDYLSVEQFGAGTFNTHLVLLEKEIVIVEGLDLRAVPAGDYELFCLPLKLDGGKGDGAPARVILREIETKSL